MTLTLLDTDILSEVLKQKNATVVSMAADYLTHHGQFAVSAMTYYEVLRGLRFKDSSRQLLQFERFCSHAIIHPISEAILDHAADLWVDGEQGGYPHRDADLIIAATALEHGCVLVTGNTQHFAWILGLVTENWRIA